MRSYQEALNHYNSISKPPRSKKWEPEVMPDNGKPLRRTSENHMGIHMTDDGVIYYRLYDTHVAKFYPPEADGVYRVDAKYVNTRTTSQFMWDYGLQFYTLETTAGEKVAVPYVENGNWRDNHLPTATMYFTADGKLIKERSSHKDVYTMVSSPEDKAKRKELRDKVEHLITLALFKLPNLKEDVTLEGSLGQPFATSYGNSPRGVEHIKQHLRSHELSIDDNTFIDLFMSGLQDAFNLYASKVCYDAGLFRYQSFWHIENDQERDVATSKFKIEQQDKRYAMVADITPDGFKKSLTSMLLSATNNKVGSVKKPWGQFMPKLPVKWIA